MIKLAATQFYYDHKFQARDTEYEYFSNLKVHLTCNESLSQLLDIVPRRISGSPIFGSISSGYPLHPMNRRGTQ
jgi:hypothetical protein